MSNSIFSTLAAEARSLNNQNEHGASQLSRGSLTREKYPLAENQPENLPR